MKKLLYAIPALSLLLLPACSAEEGTMPGTESTPAVTVYSFTPQGEGINPDNDIRVMFATNSATKEVAYLVEPVATYDAFMEEYVAKDTEAAFEEGKRKYAEKVLQNGEKVSVNGAENINITLKGIVGKTMISAVAVGTTDLKFTTFTGLDWTTVTAGTFYPQQTFVADRAVESALQICTTDKTLYRIQNAFTEGYSMKFQLLDIQGRDEDGIYTYARVPAADTAWAVRLQSQPDPVAIWVQDIGYWQNNAAFVTDGGYESRLYEDNSCLFQLAWMAGSLGYLSYTNNSYFIPD